MGTWLALQNFVAKHIPCWLALAAVLGQERGHQAPVATYNTEFD